MEKPEYEKNEDDVRPPEIVAWFVPRATIEASRHSTLPTIRQPIRSLAGSGHNRHDELRLAQSRSKKSYENQHAVALLFLLVISNEGARLNRRLGCRSAHRLGRTRAFRRVASPISRTLQRCRSATDSRSGPSLARVLT